MSAGQTTASPAATRIRSSPTAAQPPPSMTIRYVVFGFECGSIRAPRPKASSDTTPRPSLWMTRPVIPVVPGGPSGRRCPTPNRRTSIGMSAVRLAPPAAAPGGLRPDRRFRAGELRAREVALPREAMLIGCEDRREAAEADPDEDRQPHDRGRQHDEEVEHEDRADEQQAERDDPRPEELLIEVEVRRVAMEGARPDVVEDDERDEQDERCDPGRHEQVGEVAARERLEEVLPGRQVHVRSSRTLTESATASCGIPADGAVCPGRARPAPGSMPRRTVYSAEGHPRPRTGLPQQVATPARCVRRTAAGWEECRGASPAVSGQPGPHLGARP